MADLYLSTKGNGQNGNLSDLSTLHVGSSSTSADTIELRITTTATNMNRSKVFEALENFKRVLLQGSLHATKFAIP